MTRWSIQPLVPTALWLALAVATAALLALYAWRKPLIVSRRRWTAILCLMTVAIGLVLVLLLNPIRVAEIPPPAGKPLLTVLVDNTASMKTPDADGITRYDAAVDAANRISRRLGDKFDLRVFTFSNSVLATDVNDLKHRPPTAQSTDLSAAIAASLDEDRPQGQAVVLLSDGADNARDETGARDSSRIRETARLARAMSSPVFTRTLGSQAAGGFDLAVEIPSPQDMALANQKVLLTARISAIGLAGAHPNVFLMQDGKEVARASVDVSGARPAEAQFWVSQSKAGAYSYEVRVEPLPGEMTQANNAAVYLLRVLDEPIRVLQIEGKPYWDSKFLLRTLASAPAVELDSAVRLADDRVMWRTLRRGGEQYPATHPAATSPSDDSNARVESWKILTAPASILGEEKSLSRYQILVIGRDAEAFLTETALANIQNWVSRSGGALVCYRGSPTARANERLAKLLPVRWTPAAESRFHVAMTDEGKHLHWLSDAVGAGSDAETLRRLPTLAATALPQRSKPLATVLAETVATSGEATPAVIYQPYGSGRVVVIEGAGMWRWAFMPPQYQKQEEVYRTLWHSLMRWLVSDAGLLVGQKAMLRARQLTFTPDEPATVNLFVREETLSGNSPLVELQSESGRNLGQFKPISMREDPSAMYVDFGKLPEGRYHAKIVASAENDSFSRIVFDVRRKGEEELNLAAQPELMQRIAQESGGAVLEGDIAESLSAKFAEHMARLHPPRSLRTTAWDRWWVLMLVIMAWGASWWLRRSGGLV